MKKKTPKLKTLIAKLDGLFSKFIRRSHADGRGNLRCFTCEKVAPIAEMDCGHFIGRQHKATRWLERNAHPQCRYCNRYCEGRKDVYALRLMEKYGPNILLELQAEKRRNASYKPVDLLEMIDQYKAKLAELA